MAQLFANTSIRITVELVLDPAEIDLSAVTSVDFVAIKPDNSRVVWSAIVQSVVNKEIFYQTAASETDLAGKYTCQIVLNFGPSDSIASDIFHFPLRARL